MSSGNTGSRARLILPVMAAGVLVACGVMLARSRRPHVLASEVTAEIHRIALQRSEQPGLGDGGAVGPWWIAATKIDPETGQLLNFRLTSGDLHVAARSALLIVDPAADTFSFELFDAALTRLPDSPESNTEITLLSLEHHMLGPAPYEADIRADAPSGLGTQWSASAEGQ